MDMKTKKNQFPKSKLQWVWENMQGSRWIFMIAVAGTLLYNILQLTVPYFSGQIVELFLTGDNDV